MTLLKSFLQLLRTFCICTKSENPVNTLMHVTGKFNTLKRATESFLWMTSPRVERARVNDCDILEKHVSSGLNWGGNVRLEALENGCNSLPSQRPEKNISSWAESNVSLIPSVFVLIEHVWVYNVLIRICMFACQMSCESNKIRF